MNQEDSTAVLEGFTITGGTGTIWLDAKDLAYFREGGGILCELGSPTIRHNHIVNNAAVAMTKNVKGDSLLSAGGGAIRCGYSEPKHHEQHHSRQPRAVRRRGRTLPLGRHREEQPHRRQQWR